MTSQARLAHQLAAGFLEQASRYARVAGGDDANEALQQALAKLRAEYSCRKSPSDPASEPIDLDGTRAAVLLACEIALTTLSADPRQMH